ncbi:SRPBCC family protein [Pleomorphovibrio marinus]|uniref:SRPBCC domain-containing protein n=1 Tax=Pleomorphovibrio marinus TaxID=2164132 RepID=UPI000E0A7DF5|nr:SRPBCC domain-containing protein [Pleomorphovibrio marinus]
MNTVKERLEFSISIKAPRSIVWEKMLADQSYRKWASVFMQGSHFIGDWSTESKILFLAPDKKGINMGMVSRIRKNRSHELISIEHLGLVSEGNEDTESEEAINWAGAMENYLFQEKDGHTVLNVELDTTEEYKRMFQDTWPKALERIKELCEKS